MHIRSSIGLASLLAFLAVGCRGDAEQLAPPQPRPVKYATIASSSVGGVQSFPATVQPRAATKLSFRVAGTVSRVYAKAGQAVKKGDALARLERADFNVSLSEARASYTTAQTARDTAASSFARTEKLFEAGSSSQADYEAARGQLRSSQAQLNAASLRVQQARNQLEYTELKAAAGGIVNSVSIHTGEQVSAGASVIILSKGGDLRVNAGLPENLISQVELGLPGWVTIKALSQTRLKATVRKVSVIAENSTYIVGLDLNEPLPALRAGMSAQVQFSLGDATQSLRVPAAAVGNGPKGTFVFLLKKSGEKYVARRRSVSLGELVGQSFPVVEGLVTGDQVAVAGLGSLVDGLSIQLLAPTTPGVKP